MIPLATREEDVRLHHLHTRFGGADLDVVLPMRRLCELAAEDLIGHPARPHYSTMGYILDATELIERTVPAIARSLTDERVEALALAPAYG